MNFTKKLDLSVLGWFAALSATLMILFGIAAWREQNQPWMETQRLFHEQLRQADPTATLDPIAVKQILALELNRVDRCTTCHQGIDDQRFANAVQPFKTHPNLDMITTQHPLDRFGCTSCHGGQGLGTKEGSAHGFVHKWDRPMLGDREHLTKYVQASCAQCHTDPTKWEAIGAPKLARGYAIVQEKACNACHKFGDVGGAIGPELTYEGDKIPEQFGFDKLHESLDAGEFGETAKTAPLEHDAVVWHRYHFLKPAAVSSGSLMPAFGFNDEDLDALITYVLSLQRRTVPASMQLSGAPAAAKPKAQPAPAAAPVETAVDTKKGEQLYAATCAACHGPAGAGTPGVFPPLAGSEFTNQDPKRHIQIVLKGLSGPITVKGQPYNSVMTPFANLSDEDIAAIISHERTSWGNAGGTVTAADVKALR